MAARNEAVAYETRNMEGGMDMFEKQFDGVVKVMKISNIAKGTTDPRVEFISQVIRQILIKKILLNVALDLPRKGN